MLTKFQEFPLIMFEILKEQILEDLGNTNPLFPEEENIIQLEQLNKECAHLLN